jgi:hypothetical protein
MLFIFLFVSCCLIPTILLERYHSPNNHILIKCEQELLASYPIVVQMVERVTPFATKIKTRPFKVIWLSAYIITFIICLLISRI